MGVLRGLLGTRVLGGYLRGKVALLGATGFAVLALVATASMHWFVTLVVLAGGIVVTVATLRLVAVRR